MRVYSKEFSARAAVYFGKTGIEICGPNLYASFGTFCTQIGQLFEAQRVVDFEILPNV